MSTQQNPIQEPTQGQQRDFDPRLQHYTLRLGDYHLVVRRLQNPRTPATWTVRHERFGALPNTPGYAETVPQAKHMAVQHANHHAAGLLDEA